VTLQLLAILICLIPSEQIAAQPPVAIQVDLDRPIGPYKPIYTWFGYDEANYTTMRYGRQLLAELHDLSPAPVYIRVHHLLTSGDGVPDLKWSSTNVYTLDEVGKPVYNFTILDQIFDAWKSAGVRPIVELGFMPRALASGPDPYQVRYPGRTTAGSSNSPPKDYAAWGELVRRVTEHLVERYGREEASTWYWEVWNEPDIDYWHGTPQEYYKLYDYSVAAIRGALPQARVGGPASTGPGSEKAAQFLDNFLKHCADDRSSVDGGAIPLDFISFHPKGSPRMIDGHVRMGLSNELNAISAGFQIVAKFPQFIRLPIILSEADPEGCAACSARVNPANNYRNGPLYPVYTAAAMKAIFELADRYKVNLISMLSWSFEFEGHDYFEGFRSLATNGVDKPVLNVFRMAGLMSGNRVSTVSSGKVPFDSVLRLGVRESPDIDALATRSDREAAVLVWNYHDDDLPTNAAPVTVNVNGIPPGVQRVLVEHFRIDKDHSNSYSVWQAMGSPQSPTPAEYERLRQAGQLQSMNSPVWLDVERGKVSIAMDLPRQAISLLRLRW
jgi:xylan 1,4-beta-xylosidase